MINPQWAKVWWQQKPGSISGDRNMMCQVFDLTKIKVPEE